MNLFKKVIKGLFITILSIVLLIVAADLLWIFVPQLRASKKIEDLNQYARSTSEITIPAETKVVSLGEASHGNSTFQEMKLSVLKQLVEKEGVRCFALEAAFGEGLAVNQYIHGGEGTAKDAVDKLSFTIYHTQQMVDLIQWMHDYNETAEESEQLNFYGFDMQNCEYTILFLKDFFLANNIDPTNFSDSADPFSEEYPSIDYEKCTQFLLTQKEQSPDDYDLALAIACCKNMIQFDNYGDIDFSDYISANNYRDTCMAENVSTILEIEESLGHERIFISGHNGHIATQGTFYKTMGSHLKETYGNAYYAIGTDYYKTTCNINVMGPSTERGNYTFCSADPLAKSAKHFFGSYYLRFDKLPLDSETYQIVNAPMYTGSLGEGYSFMMHLLPTSHRIQIPPANMYNAMIFTYEAEPIEVLE